MNTTPLLGKKVEATQKHAAVTSCANYRLTRERVTVMHSMWGVSEMVKSFRRNYAKGIAIAAILVLTAKLNGATHLSATTRQPDVQSKVDAAADGDTVVIPAGNATWQESLTIAKNITLRGAGIGNTVIVDEVARNKKAKSLIQVKLSKDQLCRITGLTLKQGTINTHAASGGILSAFGKIDNASSRIPGIPTKFRLDHVSFEGFRSVCLRMTNIVGVIDHCVFSGSGSFLQVYHPAWNGGAHGHGSWAANPDWGSDRFLFVEDCTISHIGSGVLKGSDAYEGARYVVRHCTFNNAGVTGHGTEASGRGTKEIEIYENTFNAARAGSHFNALRSGSALMHDNIMNNYAQGLLLRDYRLFISKPRWGGATGTNPYDKNATDGALGGSLCETGTHSGVANAGALTDSSKHWKTDQWKTTGSPNLGYVYIMTNTTVANPSSPSPASILSNTETTVAFANHVAAVQKIPPLRFNRGDHYEIRKVLIAIDQPGQGKSDLMFGLPATPKAWPHSGLEPCYSWNNWTSTSKHAQVDMVAFGQGMIKEGRDYFNRTPKPGYKPYVYPHPLTTVE